jgi:SNF2 family DNA or RNA helicase
MKLQATHRIILTGTPVQNHLGELWNLFQFANPGLLGSHEQFRQKYIIPIEMQDNKERSRQLKRIVAPFMLRRTKQEVVEELPEKTEINVPVELTDDELAIYEVIRRRAKQLLEDEQASAGVSVNTLAEITRLRQAACSAQLVEKNWTGDCSKLTALSDLLQEIIGGGNAVLIFSQFTSFLAIAREMLDRQKQPYLYLDGSVSIKQRDKLVQDFQHGRCPIFLISLKAGGLGLNLTGANYVIHLDPWWNPAIEQQATDRAYRIGQRQNVTVYHLISQHTIEEKILRLHETKRNLADAMLEGTSQSHKLSSEELLQMLGA